MYKQEEAQTAGQQSIMFSFCRKFCFLILLDVPLRKNERNKTFYYSVDLFDALVQI